MPSDRDICGVRCDCFDLPDHQTGHSPWPHYQGGAGTPNHDIRIVDGRSHPEHPVKLSVMITSYNHESYIAQALDSVLMQVTNFDYEIIVGEDCSTDRTRDILVDYQQRHPEKMVLVLPDQNLGRGGIELFRNMVPIARGQYAAFMDGDDYWISSQKLEKQVDFLERNPEYGMCCHNVLCIEEDGYQKTYEKDPPNHKEILTLGDVLRGDFGAASSHMYRRSIITHLPDWVWEPYGDFLFAILAAHRSKIGYIREVMGVYRLHSRGIWTQLGRIGQLKGTIAHYQQIEQHVGDQWRSLVHDEVARRYYELAVEYENQGDLNAAKDSIEQCLKTNAGWLQEVDPSVGHSGLIVIEQLRKKHWLYEHPIIYRIDVLTEPIFNRLEFETHRTIVRTRGVVRFCMGESAGILCARPNPVIASEGQVAMVCLLWNSANAEELQIRLGSPNGPMFSCGGPSGSAYTGVWVRDGMKFYLQDVSNGKLLSFAYTLDIVCVRVLPARVPIKDRT